MTALINGAIAFFGLFSIALGVQAAFFPRPGHEASMVSLFAAGGVGLLALASLAVWKLVNPRAGRIMALVVAVLTLFRFLMTWVRDFSAMYPAGIMTLLSILLIGLLGYGHMAAKRESQAPPVS